MLTDPGNRRHRRYKRKHTILSSPIVWAAVVLRIFVRSKFPVTVYVGENIVGEQPLVSRVCFQWNLRPFKKFYVSAAGVVIAHYHDVLISV